MTRPTTIIALLAAVMLAACADPGPDAVEPLALGRGVDVDLPRNWDTLVARVPRGATLASLLRAHVGEIDVTAIISRVAAVFDPRLFRADRQYRIDRRHSGELRRFEYEIDADRLLRVVPSPERDGYSAEVVPIAKVARRAIVRGSIDRDTPSLFGAVDRAGEEGELAVSLADVFASDVDFNTELQPGDAFQLIVDKQYRSRDGAFGGYEPILGASLQNDGRNLHAIRFTPEGGAPGYYDANGNSLRRFFLRSPLKFEPVVTSAFSRRRLHPVLHVRRAHLGVDYRAPTGAPVVAVATGVVVSAGWNGGSGRMVHLRHANDFESQYLHLSSIAVRKGTRVQQGDLIGRVGSTGVATGPHLDYRLKKRGIYINPVTAHRAMPPGDPVPDGQRAAFEEVRHRVLAALASGTVK
jgi:murein DD-endopeptidase MepM/ murein hydrolase activator NlpD